MTQEQLLAVLPQHFSQIIGWAEGRSALALQTGGPLNQQQLEIANRVGVRFPARIRIAYVASIQPFPPDLASLAEAAEFPSDLDGQTFGYGIFIRLSLAHDSHLLAHECVHTRQAESLGGLEAFLRVYVPQVIRHRYKDAPLEIEARNVAAQTMR